ncbi:MAG TPA: hypothetical protein VNF07_03175 [Acidimicrobiales bacterium]|nr:hypothetical protein [Acidimicrobiales bacterium]
MSEFTGISISEARVESKLAGSVTLTFCLFPTPIPVQWKSMFMHISGDKHGSVISTTNPVLHGNDVVWAVVEGDIPNAKHFVEERVGQANALFGQMLVDVARQDSQKTAATLPSEIARLQRLLDEA